VFALKDPVERPAAASAVAGRPEQTLALRAAYATCRTITRDASKTFYLASLFLAPEKRRAIWAVYAFCRSADDLVDRATHGHDPLVGLERLERHLLAALRGAPVGPILTAYGDAARRFDIPVEPALALLRGARMDLTIRRYATYRELCEYCYLVASTVGLLVAPVLGYASPEALEYGAALGHAMQLTNILRDVGEDAGMGRIYLPADELARFGYGESDVLARSLDDRFVALMRFQIERVRAIYAQAEPGIAMLSPGSRYTVRLALSLYRRILDRIERNGYDVYSRRAFVPLGSKLATALAIAVAR